MLILSRRVGESICIGDGIQLIRITVVQNSGGQIKIGVAAPKSVSVHREEIYEKIQREKAEERTLNLAGLEGGAENPSKVADASAPQSREDLRLSRLNGEQEGCGNLCGPYGSLGPCRFKKGHKGWCEPVGVQGIGSYPATKEKSK